MGRDIAGRAVMANLAEMPHILISGATGAGKSSCINSIITSILMRDTPDQVKLMLIDPKRVELGQYDGLPHLINPVVVDPKKAANALAWAVKEMERRYDLLAENGMRDITGYNQLVAQGLDRAGTAVGPTAGARSRRPGPRRGPPGRRRRGRIDDEPEPPQTLPFILVVVDELNDLMMVAARDVEDSIVRIAQMARAVGIHLVIATQRPSVDVITGVIKANIPSRMAFSVSSLADSRVILDQPGAERLIGKGDMLLLTASSNIPRRLQAPWVSEEEVREVVAPLARPGWAGRARRRDRERRRRALGRRAASTTTTTSSWCRRVDLVVRSQLGSTSMLQRKLRVGFARAGRLMDLLEQAGVVGPSEGSKARAVLMTPDELDALSGVERGRRRHRHGGAVPARLAREAAAAGAARPASTGRHAAHVARAPASRVGAWRCSSCCSWSRGRGRRRRRPARARPDPAPSVTAALARDGRASRRSRDAPWPATGQSAVAVPSIGIDVASGPEQPVPIASLTKIMTAYVVLHDHPLAPANRARRSP